MSPRSDAERAAAYRARKKAGTGPVKTGAPVTQPCGTRAGYTRHRSNGEAACQACKTAHAAYFAARKK